MRDSIVILSVDEYRNLVEANGILEAVKRVVRANCPGLPDILSNLLDVYIEKQGDGTNG